MICYQFVRYNKELNIYEIDKNDSYYSQNDLNGVCFKDNYIIGLDCVERFIQLLFRPDIIKDFKLIYSHNGSNYDSILVL